MAASIPGFEPLPGKRIALLGARDLEPAEDELLGWLEVRRECEGMRNVYLHFDLDVLDPSQAVWNQWAPPHGLTVQAVIEQVRGLSPRAAGFASYDPDARSADEGSARRRPFSRRCSAREPSFRAAPRAAQVGELHLRVFPREQDAVGAGA